MSTSPAQSASVSQTEADAAAAARAVPADAGYLLGSDPVEIRRLLAQAELLAQEAEWLLDELALGEGAAVVDVGCGPLGLLAALAARVGPHGRVVGVDSNPVMVRAAQERCQALGLGQVAVLGGDARGTGLAPGAFDLAHVRLVLVNVADPAGVIGELVRLVKPGGVVAVQELDWLSWCCEPPHPAWDSLRGRLHELWRSRGFDPYIGRRLPGLLRAAGLVDVRAMAHTGLDGADQPYQRLILDFARRFTAPMVELGLASAAELAELIAELEAHLSRPGALAMRAMTVQAWGRAPGAARPRN
ncbi:MAG: methyltransferase domain-containing protein [Acidimicrobiales bacterium]